MARRLLIYVGGGAALVYAFCLLRRSFTTVEVGGESMLPALRPGEFLIVRRRLPRGAAGRIAYLRSGDGRPLLKRIVGLPGESLRVGSHVEVNGRTLVEEYATGRAPETTYRGANHLGRDEYFVLGDNRAASTDSRQFGPLRAVSIEGVVWLRYWPLSRFGTLGRPPRRFAVRGSEGENPAAKPEPALVPLHDAR